MLVHVIVLKISKLTDLFTLIYIYNFFHFTLKHLSKLFYKIKGIFGRKDNNHIRNKSGSFRI